MGARRWAGLLLAGLAVVACGGSGGGVPGEPAAAPVGVAPPPPVLEPQPPPVGEPQPPPVTPVEPTPAAGGQTAWVLVSGPFEALEAAADGRGQVAVLHRGRSANDQSQSTLSRYTLEGARVHARTLSYPPRHHLSLGAVAPGGDAWLDYRTDCGWKEGTCTADLGAGPIHQAAALRVAPDGTFVEQQQESRSSWSADDAGRVLAGYDAVTLRQAERVLWREAFVWPETVYASSLVGADGDVLLVGRRPYGQTWLQRRGPGGEPRWSLEVASGELPPRSSALTLAVAPDGSFIVAGPMCGAFTWGARFDTGVACPTPAFTVLAADGEGRPRWARVLRGVTWNQAVAALAPGGQVLLAAPGGCRVLRLDADGTERWTRDLGTCHLSRLSATPGGGAVISGHFDAPVDFGNGLHTPTGRSGFVAVLSAGSEGPPIAPPRAARPEAPAAHRVRWTAHLPSGSQARVAGAAADRAGNVYVAAEGLTHQTQLVKLDAQGTHLWTRPLPLGRTFQLKGTESGELYAAGYLCADAACTGLFESYPVNHSLHLLKLSSEGEVLWRVHLPYSSFFTLAVNAHGEAAVAVLDESFRELVRRYRADGSFVAEQTVNVDWSRPTLALGSDGRLLWGEERSLAQLDLDAVGPLATPLPAPQVDRVELAADGRAAVQVAGTWGELSWGGRTRDASYLDALVLVRDAQGRELWSAPIESPGGYSATALTAEGDLYTLGTGGGLALAGHDATGQRRWTRSLRYPLDSAQLTVGPQGVVVAGTHQGWLSGGAPGLAPLASPGAGFVIVVLER